MSDQPPRSSAEPSPPLAEPVETPPLLRVVKGAPTPEELGALVAVVASLGGPAPTTRRTPVWNAPSRLQRRVLRHGPGAWRGSGLPHA